MSYPFIYISAIMRTGSTLVSELLTHPPRSYIFREPHIGKNDFQLKPGDSEIIHNYFDLDLARIVRKRLPYAFAQRRLRVFGYRQDYMVRFLKHTVWPLLNRGETQIGVKEIDNVGWQNYLRHFPDMKVILLGRDPRDIYLSMVYRRRKEGAYHKYDLADPTAVAAALNRQFQLQMAIQQAADTLPVTYETLTGEESASNKILAFANSPLSTPGKVGQFLSQHPQRRYEYSRHQGKITQFSQQRWQRENDTRLREQANAVFAHMPDYCEFWGYVR